MDMPFQGNGVWLVNWLGNWVLEGGIGGIPYSTYKNTPYRLDKSRSALAEARLKRSNVPLTKTVMLMVRVNEVLALQKVLLYNTEVLCNCI